MVTFKNREKTREIQDENCERKLQITANTPYESCRERLTAFGGLLALVKMLDLIHFSETFDKHYVHPKRSPKLGDCRMITGILMLLFIGFQRLWHFEYVRRDGILCGFLKVKLLPRNSGDTILI